MVLGSARPVVASTTLTLSAPGGPAIEQGPLAPSVRVLRAFCQQPGLCRLNGVGRLVSSEDCRSEGMP